MRWPCTAPHKGASSPNAAGKISKLTSGKAVSLATLCQVSHNNS
ncbi:hypothetical protein [Okeania sp. KiyG1]|nr:hypothetical protein [Okeania sp. KiyG1]